jgi:hypothetical protein
VVGYPKLAATRSVVSSDSFREATRIAEIEGVPAGQRRVVVTLTLAGVPVATRKVSFNIRGTRRFTVVISRDCLGLSCDSAGAELTCLGGRCMDAHCTPETPEFCSDAPCETDSQCASEVACAPGECAGGICLMVPDRAQCDEGLDGR